MLTVLDLLPCVPGYVQGEGRGRGELAQLIPFFGGLQPHVPHIWVVISCDFRSRCRGLGTVARSLAAGWVCKPDRFVDSARNDSSRSLHGVAMSNRRDRDVEENTYETDL